MSQGSTPARLSIHWPTEAQADLRAIDWPTALDILHCIGRYLATRSGDVKKLKPPMTGFRFRCAHYRVFFKQAGENGISITGVQHRKDAYR